jgi:hypothetical protein
MTGLPELAAKYNASFADFKVTSAKEFPGDVMTP